MTHSFDPPRFNDGSSLFVVDDVIVAFGVKELDYLLGLRAVHVDEAHLVVERGVLSLAAEVLEEGFQRDLVSVAPTRLFCS